MATFEQLAANDGMIGLHGYEHISPEFEFCQLRSVAVRLENAPETTIT
ncbi:MAG TPA: hypothetical protein VIL39_03280 [Verrucomicrobiae bacterium]|jgi:predicted deacetylase